MSRVAGRAVAVLGLGVVLASSSLATRTQRWIVDPTELQRGESDGVAITEKGRLFLAPRVELLGSGRPPGDPLQVWAVAADSRDNIYLGTGPDGEILRVGPSGRQSLFFAVDEPLVTALAISPEGDLLAAGSPGGRIYRIDANGTGVVFSETERRYIWALEPGEGGSVYAGAGEQGEVLRLDSRGRVQTLFDSEEAHIVQLLALPGGELLAGGAGRGLVYRIDRDGNGIAIYDDDLLEVAALAVDDQGNVLAATIAAPAKETKPPAVRIRLPESGSTTRPGEPVGAMEDAAGPMIQGEIEGLPSSKPRASRSSTRGRLVRVAPSGDTEVLWRSQREVPLALALSRDGTVYFGTGQPARLYRVESGEDVALLATLPEAQLTGLLDLGGGLLAATSNPAAAYRIVPRGAESGVFVSQTIDAGGTARWGTIRWRLEDVGGRVEVYTRTGNSPAPDDTWSGWGPARVDPSGSPIDNPDGRYLQWRVRFSGSGATDARLSSFRVSYELRNRAPAIREFYIDAPSGSVSSDAVLRWSSYDADSDPVEIRVQYRPLTGTDWIELERPAADADAAGDEGSPVNWLTDRVVWDTGQLDEGEYRVRAIASDEAANHPGEGHRVVLDNGLTFVVDRTPPEIRVVEAANGRYEVLVTDRFSDIERLSVRLGTETRFSARPEDGVSDSGRETYRFSVPEDGEGAWSVEAVDVAGNTAELPLEAG